MRFLAIDLGDRRTGLAVGDDETRVATPLETIEIEPGARLEAAILERVGRHDPDALVVGLPLNMDGTEGPAAKRARVVGRQLATLAGLDVHFQDERLTSFAAEKKLDRSGRTRGRKKALRDALAAAEILRDFLDARGERH